LAQINSTEQESQLAGGKPVGCAAKVLNQRLYGANPAQVVTEVLELGNTGLN